MDPSKSLIVANADLTKELSWILDKDRTRLTEIRRTALYCLYYRPGSKKHPKLGYIAGSYVLDVNTGSLDWDTTSLLATNLVGVIREYTEWYEAMEGFEILVTSAHIADSPGQNIVIHAYVPEIDYIRLGPSIELSALSIINEFLNPKYGQGTRTDTGYIH